MTTDPTQTDAQRFRKTLIKVMTVQIVTLLLLWWLQASYSY